MTVNTFRDELAIVADRVRRFTTDLLNADLPLMTFEQRIRVAESYAVPEATGFFLNQKDAKADLKKRLERSDSYAANPVSTHAYLSREDLVEMNRRQAYGAVVYLAVHEAVNTYRRPMNQSADIAV